MSTYVSMIEGLGWTYVKTDSDGYDWYVSPDQDLVIELGASSTLIQFYVEPYEAPSPSNTFPSEQIQTLLFEYLGVTTEVPAYEGFTNYEVQDYFDYIGVIFVYFDGDASVEGYQQILESEGWTVTIDEEGHGFAYDSGETLQIDFQVMNEGESNQYFMMSIGQYIDQSYNYEGTEYPSEQVSRFLEEYCEGSEVVIPECSGTYYTCELYDSYGINLLINVTDAETTAYFEALVGAGFTFNGDYGDYYAYSNSYVHVDVDTSAGDGSALIWIYYAEY